MNLADAIRKAAQSTGTQIVPEGERWTPRRVEIEEEEEQWGVRPQPTQPKLEETAPAPAAQPAPAPYVEPREVTLAPVSQSSASPVRLELALTPEQLDGLLKGVVKAQHSIMTLREAARHLRVSSATLETLASQGEIPAFLIDGKWRFSRNNLDEWLREQSVRKEMEA